MPKCRKISLFSSLDGRRSWKWGQEARKHLPGGRGGCTIPQKCTVRPYEHNISVSKTFFRAKSAHTHKKIVILHCFPVVFVRVYERQSCLERPKALFTAVLWAYIWIFECKRLYFQIWNRLWRQKSTMRSSGEIAILHCFLVVFVRQSCLEWLTTLFSVVLAG